MKTLTFDDMKKIAKAYDVKLIYDGTHTDGGASAGSDTIWVFRSRKQWIKELSFWHELGHVICAKRSIDSGLCRSMSTVSCEGNAWETGLVEAAKYGRKWDYNSEQMCWARKCLASYVHGEYDDLIYVPRAKPALSIT